MEDLDYYFKCMKIPLLESISSYTELTGRRLCHPKWSLGSSNALLLSIRQRKWLQLALPSRDKDMPAVWSISGHSITVEAYIVFNLMESNSADAKVMISDFEIKGFRVVVELWIGTKPKKGIFHQAGRIRSDLFLKYPDGKHLWRPSMARWWGAHFLTYQSLRPKNWWGEKNGLYTEARSWWFRTDKWMTCILGQFTPKLNWIWFWKALQAQHREAELCMEWQMARSAQDPQDSTASKKSERPTFVLTGRIAGNSKRLCCLAWTGNKYCVLKEQSMMAGIRLVNSPWDCKRGLPLLVNDVWRFLQESP